MHPRAHPQAHRLKGGSERRGAPAFDAPYCARVPATPAARNMPAKAFAADGVFRPRAAHALKS
ncbi:MAG: hypothetical protein PPHEMADM_1033 [uncultured Paraburkholderia sp.]|nr:MAG: hypothetical protein PPHEMADM_1033 [uncultured Paraburkholderia sp.]